MKRIALIALAVLVGTAVLSQGDPARNAKPGAGKPSAEDVLGAKEGKPIDAGFVFVNGKYIEAPYSVARRGAEIYVNGERIAAPVKWPPVDYEDKKPTTPPGLTRNSTFDDLGIPELPGESWDRRMVRWIKRHHTKEQSRQLIKDYYEGLPFVRKVETRRGCLRVFTHRGNQLEIDIGEPVYRPPTKEETIAELDRVRTRFGARLEKGDCFFFFGTNVEISFGQRKAAKDMGLIVDVLQSDRSKKDKLSLLQRLGVLPPERAERFTSLVTNFKSSEQLTRRIDLLEKAMGVTPRQHKDIPEIPGADAERGRADERAAKERSGKERGREWHR